jgi:hypothetical protein
MMFADCNQFTRVRVARYYASQLAWITGAFLSLALWVCRSFSKVAEIVKFRQRTTSLPERLRFIGFVNTMCARNNYAVVPALSRDP